jgi:hypothetical protein
MLGRTIGENLHSLNGARAKVLVYAGAVSVLAVGCLAFASSALALTPVGVRTSNLVEVEPAAASGYLVWTQNSKAHPNRNYVYAKPQGSSLFRVTPRGTTGRSWGGAIDGTTLVFTQWPSPSASDGDLKMFDLATRSRSTPPGVNTSRNENGASLSGDWLLFRRTTLRSSTEKIILRNLTTDEQRVLDERTGRAYAQPGNVAGNYAVWFRCLRFTKCNTYLYDIGLSSATKLGNPLNRAQYAPAVTDDGTVYLFEAQNALCRDVRPRLFRYTLGQPRERLLTMPHNRDPSITSVLVNGGGGTTLYFDRYNCRTGSSDIYKVDVP